MRRGASERGHFPSTKKAHDWIKHFRDLESSTWADRLGSAKTDPKESGPGVACILVVAHPVQSLSAEEQLAELGRREALARTGAILLERPEHLAPDVDDRPFVDSWLAAVRQQLPPTSAAPPAAPTASFFNWKVAPAGLPEAEQYGRQTAHAPLPANDQLTEMFKQSSDPEDASAREDLNY